MLLTADDFAQIKQDIRDGKAADFKQESLYDGFGNLVGYVIPDNRPVKFVNRRARRAESRVANTRSTT